MRLREAAEALREPGFAWFFAARTLRTLGSSMTSVALAFAVLQVSGSAEALATVLAAYLLSNVVFVLFGGVVADRLSRTLVLQGCAVVAALTQGGAALLVGSGSAQIWQLAALAALSGAVEAFAMPATVGIVPLVVRPAFVQQANSLLGFSRGAITVAGPAIAGLLVVAAGPAWALAGDGLAVLASVPLLARVRLPRRAQADAAGASLWHDLRTGWGEFRARTWLWVVVAVFAVLNAVHIGAVGVLGPVTAKANPAVGESGWGLVLSAEAAGALVLTVVLLRVRLHRPLVAGLLAITAVAVPLTVLAFGLGTPWLAAGFFIAGAGIEIFGVGWLTALQQHVPEAVLSRVSSYDSLGSFVAMPVGAFVYGRLAIAFEPRVVLLTSAVGYAALSLATLAVPSVRALRQLSTTGATTEPTQPADRSVPDPRLPPAA